MPLEIPTQNLQVLVAFGCYLIGVVSLGLISHGSLKGGCCVKCYSLASGGWGRWLLAFPVQGSPIRGAPLRGFPASFFSKGWSMRVPPLRAVPKTVKANTHGPS